MTRTAGILPGGAHHDAADAQSRAIAAAMWRSTSMYASSPTSKITFTIRPPVNSKAGVYSLLTASPPS
jgi:hypothetical protein